MHPVADVCMRFCGTLGITREVEYYYTRATHGRACRQLLIIPTELHVNSLSMFLISRMLTFSDMPVLMSS